jgi:subfamily B ATP-binding cassette protein MsbA
VRCCQLNRFLARIFGISENELNAFIWIIRSYLWQHRVQFLQIWLLGAGIVWATGAVVYMVGPALRSSFESPTDQSLTVIALQIIGASLLGGVFHYIQNMILEKSGQQIVASLRRDLYNHLLHMDVGFLSNNHVGELSAICMEETSLIRDVTGNIFVTALQDLILFIVLIGIIVYRDWQLSLVALGVVPLIIFGKGHLAKRRRALAEKLLESRAKITAWVSEVLFNARLIKAFGAEDRETERMSLIFDEQAKLDLSTLQARSVSQPINEFLTGGFIVLVMIVGSWRAEHGGISLADLTTILIALIAAYRPLKRLDDMGNRLQMGASAAIRIKKIFDSRSNIVDAINAVPLNVEKGCLEFKNVSFHYSSSRPILNSIDFIVPAKGFLAIVGPSGAGKTTLLNLIPRFIDPSSGSILIDGQDIRTVTQSSLRSQMALVTQETLLFDESVAANIAYGKPNASREEIIQAAKLALADEFIQDLPNGYDTMIGARGVRLSGGERQRLSIARALLINAKILILDEATSSLDNRVEHLIKVVMDQGDDLPTRIVVAHRLSTIRNADHILVIDGGAILEEGTHESLLNRKGLYAELYHKEGAGNTEH